MVASINDALWFKLDGKHDDEVDLDQKYNFKDIKCLKYYAGKFYLLANKMKDVLGIYLFELEADINSIPFPDNYRYVIKYVNKLAIGDGSIDIFHPKPENC